jgi:LysR family hydrogen peroxide-inducible transcriptional activator
VAILALPLPDSGVLIQPVYDEQFVVAVPRAHPWAKRRSVSAADLKKETMLLLGSGHCFRDQVLEVCPELSRFSSGAEGIQKTFEGSSLETIRHMVASGLGITVLPMSSVPEKMPRDSLIAYVPFGNPVPDRRVVLAWRKSFTRVAAIEALRQAIVKCPLHGVEKLDLPVESS